MQIKYKIGLCKGCGKEVLIIHKILRLCQSCNENRKRMKYAKKTLAKKKKNGVSKQKDDEFYQRIWDSREHRCFESDAYLGQIPNRMYFHHCLSKRNYPEFRYCEWNIVILHPDIHSLVEVDITKCPKVFKYTQELKQKYIENERSI